MSNSITCACGAKYRFGAELAGKRLKCQKCSAVISIPKATSADVMDLGDIDDDPLGLASSAPASPLASQSPLAHSPPGQMKHPHGYQPQKPSSFSISPKMIAVAIWVSVPTLLVVVAFIIGVVWLINSQPEAVDQQVSAAIDEPLPTLGQRQDPPAQPTRRPDVPALGSQDQPNESDPLGASGPGAPGTAHSSSDQFDSQANDEDRGATTQPDRQTTDVDREVTEPDVEVDDGQIASSLIFKQPIEGTCYCIRMSRDLSVIAAAFMGPTFTKPSGAVSSIDWIYVWHGGEEEPVRHETTMTDFEMSPDGQFILSKGEGKGEIWNTRTGEVIAELEGSKYADFSVSGDGKTFLYHNEESTTIYDIENQKQVAKLENSVAWFQRGPCTRDLSVQYGYDMKSGRVNRFEHRLNKSDVCAETERTTNYDLSGTSHRGVFSLPENEEVIVLDFVTSEVISVVDSMPVREVALSPNGCLVAASGYPSNEPRKSLVRLMDGRSGEFVDAGWIAKHPGDIFAVKTLRISEDNSHMAFSYTQSGKKWVEVWKFELDGENPEVQDADAASFTDGLSAGEIRRMASRR